MVKQASLWKLLSIFLVSMLRDPSFCLLRQKSNRHKQQEGHDDHDQPNQIPIEDLTLDTCGKQTSKQAWCYGTDTRYQT